MFRNVSLVLAAVFFCLACTLEARLYSIRLSDSAQPAGCWSLEEIVEGVTEGAAGDREKALALHRFGMAHQIHFIGPSEGGIYVQDALKLLSVYGHNLCGNNSSAMCALYHTAGLKARRRSLTGHVVPEVWFDGKWNYIDTDMFGYVFLPDDERVASVDELIARPELFDREGRRPDPYFTYDPMETMKKAFTDTEARRDCHPFSLAHMMALGLRTWESVTCYFRPQGRFHLDERSFPHKLSTQYRRYWLDGPVRTNSLAWTDTVPASYGNGLFEYEPDLSSDVFRLENPEIEGVKVCLEDNHPTLTAANQGETASVVLDVRSPWVIAGLQNDLTNFGDNSDGAVAAGWFWRIEDRDETRIYLSTDHGRTWEKIWENEHLGAVPFRVDLTPQVDGRYGYKLKFEWVDRGGSGRVGLQGLKLKTWVELSSMALPRLEPGKNIFQLSTSPHRAVLNECRWHDRESLPQETRENLGLGLDGSPRLRPVDSQMPGVLCFSPGTGGGIIDEMRISLIAHTIQGGKMRDLKAVLYLSENSGESWQELERFEPHPEHQFDSMWFNHLVRNRSLDGGSVMLKLELTDCGLDKLTVNSLVRVSPKVPTALRINHIYRENSRRQTVSWLFPPGAQTTSYEVDISEEKIYNEAVKFEAIPPEEE
ncbi:MAG: hypothetical protein U9N45_05075 [Gemmatimonadota bacterium]|nr:hypothetical protein [Gemmatimonadota bacterium]